MQSKHEKDAKIGHKSIDSDFFGYKEHISATEEGIITGITVTTGNTADNKEFKNIVEQTINNGVYVQNIVGDRAYSISEILKYGEENNIGIVSKLKENFKRIWTSTKSSLFAKQKAFEQQDEFKSIYDKRYIIEQLNAHLKGIFSMGKTYGTGLSSMIVQALLTAFSSNIVKISRLVLA